MSKKITITLSDKAEKYFNEVKYSLEPKGFGIATNSEVINEILEVNGYFERLEDIDVCGWINENYPLYYKESQEG